MDQNSLDNVKAAHANIREAMSLLGRGPLDFYLNELVLHSDALLTKFAPIKQGQRAVIVMAPKCDNGWKGSEETLSVGKEGAVQSVGYDEAGFYFHWLPDNETWQDRDGNYKPTTSRHTFCLRERHLKGC